MKDKKILLYLTIALIFSASFVIIRRISMFQLDNDTSGEMILSKCLHDENSIICNDWTYSTEFRVFNQLIFAPLFRIFNNWEMVRVSGTLILLVLLSLSFTFMMNSAGLRQDFILFGLILLLLPYCVAYGRIVLYFSFYSPYLIFMFLSYGCFFHSINKNRNICWKILLFIVSVIGCVTGIRQVFITIIPIFAISFFYLLKTRNFKLIVTSGFGLAGSFAGLLIHNLIIMKQINIQQGENLKVAFKGFSEIPVVIFSVMRQFGYRSFIEKKSFMGFMSFCGIFVMFYLLFYSAKYLFSEKDTNHIVLGGTLLTTLLLHIIVFLFIELPYNTRFDYSRYLTPASVWCIPLFCLLFEVKKKKIKNILFSLIVVLFIGNSLMNLSYFYNPAYFSQEYDGLLFRNTRDISEYSAGMDYLKSHNYDLGYSFSDANVLTEKLNGIPVIGLDENDGEMVYADWLTRKSYRNINAKRAFLCLKSNEAIGFRVYPISKYANLVFSDKEEFFIYEITDPAAFKLFLDRLN